MSKVQLARSSTCSTELYNSIGSIRYAYATFLWRGGDHFIQDVLRPLIVDVHKLEKQFGAGLLHRHGPGKECHKQVEFNNSTTQWADDAELLGGKVVGDAWMIHKGKLAAYEFKFVPFGDETEDIDFENDEVMRNFAHDFIAAVQENPALETAICLRRHPGAQSKGGMELTAGETNLVLKMDQVPEMARAQSIQTQFFFDPELKGVEWRCSHGAPDPSVN